MPPVNALDVGQSVSTDHLQPKCEITPHSHFFFPDGNICLHAGKHLFLVHLSIVLPYIAPLRDVWNELPAPSGGAEGSVDRPISMGNVDDEEMEAYMSMIYCPNTLLDNTPKPYMFYLHVLRLSSMYEWDEARAYAISQISSLPNNDLEPYLKLLLGLRHCVDAWVLSAVNTLFFSGPNLRQPVHKPIYGTILNSESRANINWILQEGSRLMEKTILELITHQPGFFSNTDDGSDWALFKCDQHQTCVKALSKQWNRISTTLVTSLNEADGDWSLAFQIGAAFERFSYAGMKEGRELG
ncbi:hypothetical protein K435DRAFT_809590 [Dendrothele bispora CBS 962.96]|uniref:BTB domain-containing protein n=1 Tax=Dendrothele bispora (strain CBS 962.96) TaxID=1314807 RepID=A0A4S8KY42_DENBC|nr:hypothetical protein K435DRAFT_809590 [Dendrothele bispora CBS 962.96]